MFQKPGVNLGIGISLFIILIAFIVSWQFFIKDKIDTVPVVVVKPGVNIAKKDVITKSDLTIQRRSRKDLINNYVPATKISDVIGEDAGQVIPGNDMVSYSMIDYDHLIPNAKKGQAIRPIPHDWIYAMPGSIRRKDHVNIYIISKDDLKNMSPDQTNPNSNQTMTASSNKKDSSVTTIPDTSFMTPILTNIPVVYAKDSSNNEVVSSDPKNQQEKRLTATGQISELEVILNNQQFEKLATAVVDKGAKLYFTYE